MQTCTIKQQYCHGVMSIWSHVKSIPAHARLSIKKDVYWPKRLNTSKEIFNNKTCVENINVALKFSVTCILCLSKKIEFDFTMMPSQKLIVRANQK